jgi:hypothetical protein
VKKTFFKCPVGWVVGALILAASLQGQQSPGQPQSPQSAQPGAPQGQTQGQPPLLEIYQIDLDPSGTAFALSKPKQEGDVYVFTAWPEGDMVRLPQAKVKKITQRTKDLNKETVYRIDLVPSGRMIARAEPKVQGGTYVFYRWKDGAFMSLRRSDVKKVARLTALPAFRAQQEELGAALIGNLPMQGGGTVRVIPAAQPAPGASAGPSQTPAPGNWIYQGVPGVTDAYAPANATVASPGDVPKAPAPAPTRPPG